MNTLTEHLQTLSGIPYPVGTVIFFRYDTEHIPCNIIRWEMKPWGKTRQLVVHYWYTWENRGKITTSRFYAQEDWSNEPLN